MKRLASRLIPFVILISILFSQNKLKFSAESVESTRKNDIAMNVYDWHTDMRLYRQYMTLSLWLTLQTLCGLHIIDSKEKIPWGEGWRACSFPGRLSWSGSLYGHGTHTCAVVCHWSESGEFYSPRSVMMRIVHAGCKKAKKNARCTDNSPSHHRIQFQITPSRRPAEFQCTWKQWSR